MHNYHFQVKINKKYNNAGSKATEDCKAILINSGFINLEISFIKAWYLLPVNLVRLFTIFAYYNFTIKANSFIIVQYPLLGINKYFGHFIKLLRKKGCRFCAIIHDLDSLRAPYDNSKIEQEIKALSPYDAVVSHNSSMSNWLVEHGYKGHIEEIVLFDYLVPNYQPNLAGKKKSEIEIAFAGSFKRGTFLKKLIDKQYPFFVNLYGSDFDPGMAENNQRIKWFGSFTPDQIVHELKGDFGLVWDGDSADEITGLTGNYLRYNTPHKTSLYLTAGLPVIVSKDAALASFIESNQIGFSVNSLSDVAAKGELISEERYALMKQNAFAIGEKLSKGNYLLGTVNRIKSLISESKLTY